MRNRRRLLWLWWLLVLGGVGVFSGLTLFVVGDQPGSSVVRVVGDDSDLWAYTQERAIMQGVDTAWWVSHDGGITWSEGRPRRDVAEADPEEQVCGAAACYRLEDGWRIERQSDQGSAWEAEYERARQSAPPGADEFRRDWEEERSIAVTQGPGPDAAVVAAGREGVLVRSVDGAWQPVVVNRPWEYRLRWWLVGIGCTVVLLGGLVVDQVIRHFGPGSATNRSLRHAGNIPT